MIDARRWVRTAKLVLLLDGTSARDADLGGDGGRARPSDLDDEK